MTRLLLIYALWIVSIALVILDLVATRSLVVAILDVIETLNPWVVAAADRVAIVILGVLGLVSVVACEYYYRRASTVRIVIKRFVRISVYQVLWLVLASALPRALYLIVPAS